MFRPGFESAAAVPGRLSGWTRRFGQPSVRNWGRPRWPAPTCSLSEGGYTDGLLFRLPGHETLGRLRAREASDPIEVRVRTTTGDVDALTWVMSSEWAQAPVGDLVEAAVVNVEQGGGPSGDAWDYAEGVSKALERNGLDDPLVWDYRDALSRRLGEGLDGDSVA